MRVDVFNGWIELRNPELVSEKLRRPIVTNAIKAHGMVNKSDEISEEELDFFSHFNDLVAVALIEKWSFDGDITIDALLELPSKAYDDIRNAVVPFVEKLIPDFGVNPDPKASTEN